MFRKLAQFGGSSNPIGNTQFQIKNPLKADDLVEFIHDILGIVVQVGVPLLVLAVVYVGFLFVAARGNSSKLEEAKTAFFWTIIGAAIVLGAFVISTALQNTINQLGV